MNVLKGNTSTGASGGCEDLSLPMSDVPSTQQL